MKKFFMSVVTTLVLASIVSPAKSADAEKSTWDRIQETKTIRLGAANTPPYYMIDPTGTEGPGAVKSNGVVWRGFGPALAKKLADDMGVKLEIVETTWGGAVAGLQAGQFDVMLALDATPKRALAIDFVNQPIMWFPIVVLTKKGVVADNWADLNKPGTVIGLENGNSLDQAVNPLLPKATFKRFPDTSASIAAFMAGQLDAYVWSGPQADLALDKFGSAQKFIPKPVISFPTAAGIRKETDRRWRDYLEASFQFLYYSGEVTRAYNQFMTGQGVPLEKITPIVRELQ